MTHPRTIVNRAVKFAREKLRRECKRPDSYILLYWRENEFGLMVDSNLTDEGIRRCMMQFTLQMHQVESITVPQHPH